MAEARSSENNPVDYIRSLTKYNPGISDNDSQEELASITSDDTGSSFDSRPIKLTIYTVKSQFDARAHIRVERIC